jgi:hypothetical protein
MGCGPSKWSDPVIGRQRRPASVGQVVVFLPGLRAPREVDFSQSLGDHLDKGIVEGLSTLRSRVVALATQESATALKPRPRAAVRHGELRCCIMSILSCLCLLLMNVNARSLALMVLSGFQEGLVLLISSRLWKSTCQFC